MDLSDFERAYHRSWEAKLRGRMDESMAAFEQAKHEAVRALQQGASPDDLDSAMTRCRDGVWSPAGR